MLTDPANAVPVLGPEARAASLGRTLVKQGLAQMGAPVTQAAQEYVTNKTVDPRQAALSTAMALGIPGALKGVSAANKMWIGPKGIENLRIPKEKQIYNPVYDEPTAWISDEPAAIVNTQGKTLGEAMKHPELFKAYSQMSDMPITSEITPTDLENARAGAQYDPIKKFIGIPENNPIDKKILLHEVQHGVQDVENRLGGIGHTDPAVSKVLYLASPSEREAYNTQILANKKKIAPGDYWFKRQDIGDFLKANEGTSGIRQYLDFGKKISPILSPEGQLELYKLFKAARPMMYNERPLTESEHSFVNEGPSNMFDKYLPHYLE
jgi:hypothetical protein